jgi:hypothetical protein
MSPILIEISIAFLIVAVCVALVVWIARNSGAASERRMMGMLKRAGVDPEVATGSDATAIIKEVRRRCRRCESEDLCDRWLEGKVVKGGNSFCPNARIFRNLARKTGRTV